MTLRSGNHRARNARRAGSGWTRCRSIGRGQPVRAAAGGAVVCCALIDGVERRRDVSLHEPVPEASTLWIWFVSQPVGRGADPAAAPAGAASQAGSNRPAGSIRCRSNRIGRAGRERRRSRGPHRPGCWLPTSGWLLLAAMLAAFAVPERRSVTWKKVNGPSMFERLENQRKRTEVVGCTVAILHLSAPPSLRRHDGPGTPSGAARSTRSGRRRP